MNTIMKPQRYELLDGLRGVAAFIVVWYHFSEGFATSAVDWKFNHGYLAVDFFFVLSGFVIGKAYDNRWKERIMTKKEFFLRRIIRLHPMVVLGVFLGFLGFLFQGSVKWDGTQVPFASVLLALIAELFLIPVWPGAAAEVRGYDEIFPLDGPCWSLFFEYIANILYALILVKLSNKALKWIIFASAIGLAGILFGNVSGEYTLCVGWKMDGLGFLGGFLRVSFSFTVGILMARLFKPRKIRGAFWICSAIVIAVMLCPYITNTGEFSRLNALYDYLCVLFVFPSIVYLGACGNTTDKFSSSSCEFFGQLSYPVYIVHYVVMYLFYAWLWPRGLSYSQTWPICVGLFFLIILLAWGSLKYYDEPVRKYLTRKFLWKNSQVPN